MTHARPGRCEAPAGGDRTRASETDRAGSAIEHIDTTSAISAATVAHCRAWWQAEAPRVGSDWDAIMRLRIAVGPLTCAMCGVAPCASPAWCMTCRRADECVPRQRPRSERRADTTDHDRGAHALRAHARPACAA